MDYLKSLLRYTLVLPLALALYLLTPWVGEQTGTDTTFLQPTSAIIVSLSTVFVWMNIILLRAAPPEANLLLTEEGKRELLWRLADEQGLERQGWPWRLKTIGVWTGYGAGFITLTLAALTLFGRTYSQPFPVLVTLGTVTLIMSLTLILTRLAFEHWAKDHPEVVDHILDTPTARAVLERSQAR